MSEFHTRDGGDIPCLASMWTDILIRPALFPPGGKRKERLFSFAYLFWACMAPNGIKLSHQYDWAASPKNIPPFWVFFDVGFPRTPFVVRSRFPFYWESDARTRIGGVTAAAGRGEGMKKSFDFFGSVWKEGGGGEDPDSIEEGRRSAMKKKKKGDPRGLQIICCDKGKKVFGCTLCVFS